MQQEMLYIYMVYQEGNFSKAAKKLYITQPALSMAIHRVEESLGMPLFERNRQPLKLTEAGKIYIKKIEQIQNLEKELSRQLNDLSELQSGSLRIGGSHYFNSYVLPPVLSAYTKRYPGIQLELVEFSSKDLRTMLIENKIDLTFDCNPTTEDIFLRFPVFHDTILLAVPESFSVNDNLKMFSLSAQDILNKKHLELTYPSIDLNEFSDTPFILLMPGNNLHTRSQHFFEKIAVQPKIVLEVSQLVTAYHLATAALGATFISDSLITSANNDNLLFYKISSAMTSRSFDLILNKNSYVPNSVKAFIKIFKEFY